jgi:hypothetical protein
MSFDIDAELETLRKEIIEAELNGEISDGLILKDFCVVYFS